MEKDSVLYKEFKDLLLSEEEQRLIFSGYEKIVVKKGELLLKKGAIVNNYYLVEKGFLRSFVLDIEGNQVTTSFYTEGNIVLEETSFFLRTATQESIEVLEDSVLWSKNFVIFQEHFNTSEKYREWGRAHLTKNFFEFKQRSLSMITKTAKERYLDLLENRPEVLQKANLKDIASYLGITDTSLSRIRKEILQ
ncbi:cAMP-binding proteins - catabolite gene activator and regulatory subunit of cAMP-dependent protein kinases [Tenacibaculum sp. 190130A14a]|uniref:Crp/Fnr family transcriptional regulator n=1 Tax=Tenacibaculum polynesiense TaxID=3137857 RepID=A0ABP1ETE5_9FLAO